MLRLPPGKCLLATLMVATCASSFVVEAKPRRLSDLGTRSAVEDSRFVAPRKELQMNGGMQAQRVEFGQWHGSFSSIGNKRSDVSTNTRFNSTMMNYPQVERRNAGIAVEAGERQMAPLRNMDQMRDIVIASDFNKMAPRTVEGRALQEMVDEMSLKDINRFQVHRNKTDEGVPTQSAGSGESPTIRAGSSATEG